MYQFKLKSFHLFWISWQMHSSWISVHEILLGRVRELTITIEQNAMIETTLTTAVLRCLLTSNKFKIELKLISKTFDCLHYKVCNIVFSHWQLVHIIMNTCRFSTKMRKSKWNFWIVYSKPFLSWAKFEQFQQEIKVAKCWFQSRNHGYFEWPLSRSSVSIPHINCSFP